VGGAGEALDAAVDALRAAGVEDPRLDAEVMLAEASGLGRAGLVAEPDAELAPAAARRFGEMVRRRLRREPVAYIAGRRGFRNIELAVDPRVLIPRPETELLVEVALEMRPPRVLDVGTGSGAVALAIADELPECQVTATDTSAAALEVARANAERLGLADRVRFLKGTAPREDDAPSEQEEFPQDAPAQGGFDLIVANLPYVAETEWSSLQPEITEWEPREALLAGPDGLDAIRALLAEPGIRGLLSERGSPLSCYAGQRTAAVRPILALEVGDGQAAAVAELMFAAGFAEVETRRDLAGIERVVIGQ